jgi:hypothetical protein
MTQARHPTATTLPGSPGSDEHVPGKLLLRAAGEEHESGQQSAEVVTVVEPWPG